MKIEKSSFTVTGVSPKYHMIKAEFVHLHTHSHYSLKEGVSSVQELVQSAARLGYDALALTDVNSLAGIPAFTKFCHSFGVKPIIGCEINILPFRARMFGARGEGDRNLYRAVLLAQTKEGFHNLVRILNRAFRNTQSNQPSITLHDLEDSHKGLFFLTGSQQGELYNLVKKARIEETEEYIRRIIHIFGKSRVYFEFVITNDDRERTINGRLAQLAHFLDIGIVAANDVRYILPEDETAYLCLSGSRTILEARTGAPFGELLSPPEFTQHLGDPEFMRHKFRLYPIAVEATRAIAESCEFDLQEYWGRPEPRIPLQDFVRGQDAESFLWDAIFEKAGHYFGALTEKIKDRLNEEFHFIRINNQANYLVFLHRLADFLTANRIHFLLAHKFYNASLIAYLLGLTDIDPVKYHVRFMPPDHDQPADDVAVFEIPTRWMDKVIDWIVETFPPGSVCELGAAATWSRPALVDHIAAWARLSPIDASFFSKNVTENLGTIRKLSGKQDSEQSNAPDFDPYLTYKSFVSKYKDQLPLGSIEYLMSLFARLFPRPKTIQPSRGSIAFCSKDLESLVPCENREGKLVSQFDEELIDALGIHRVYIAPDSMIDILDNAVTWVQSQSNPKFTLESVDFDDFQTFQFLARGESDGIYPFDSITVKTILRTRKPNSFMELVKLVTDMGNYNSSSNAVMKNSEANIARVIALCRLGFQCAYIKTHYPASFMTSVLTRTAQGGKTSLARMSKKILPVSSEPAESGLSPFISLLRHAKRLGINLKPPGINESDYSFSQEGEGIRTGLMVIRQMGEKACNEIVTVRQGGPFHDLADLCHRTDPRLINHRLLVNMIKSGALDSFGLRRSQLLHILEQTIGFAREQDGADQQIPDLFDPLESDLFSQAPDMPEFSPLDLMRMEREATGYIVSRYPLEPYAILLEAMGAVAPKDLNLKHLNQIRYLGGFIDHIDTEGPLIMEDTRMILDFGGIMARASRSVAARYGASFQINLPVMIGGIVEKKGDFPCLNATCCFSLEELLAQIPSVSKLTIDCSRQPVPDKDCLKRIYKIFKAYPGPTQVEVFNVQEGCGGIAQKIAKLKIVFCPPLCFELLKLMVPASISVFTTGVSRGENLIEKWQGANLDSV
ncbi:PHP domain-containing protein [Candidatus Sumerlaeota bacterium]|nr:PHP domain-containing protein [Candidatus Sumerlaeota bacterium]